MKKLYETTSDMPKDWNMYNLRNILQQRHQEKPISGITTPMLYASNPNSGSRLHVEDFDFGSVSLLYPKSTPKVSFHYRKSLGSFEHVFGYNFF